MDESSLPQSEVVNQGAWLGSMVLEAGKTVVQAVSFDLVSRGTDYLQGQMEWQDALLRIAGISVVWGLTKWAVVRPVVSNLPWLVQKSHERQERQLRVSKNRAIRQLEERERNQRWGL